MAFSFGFSGDDIDIDHAEIDQEDQIQGNVITAPDEKDASLPKLIEARRHEMGEWVSDFFSVSLNFELYNFPCCVIVYSQLTIHSCQPSHLKFHITSCISHTAKSSIQAMEDLSRMGEISLLRAAKFLIFARS